MNVGIFVGRLGKDAELKQFDGKNVINFSVAVDIGYGDKKDTLWVDCAKWGEKTGIIAYLKKGQQVAVQGEIGLRKWDGGATVTLRVGNVELLGGKSEPKNATSIPANSEPPKGDTPWDDAF